MKPGCPLNVTNVTNARPDGTITERQCQQVSLLPDTEAQRT